MTEILFSAASEVTDDGTPARIPTTVHQGLFDFISGGLKNVEFQVTFTRQVELPSQM